MVSIHTAMQTTLRSTDFSDPSGVDALQERLSVCIDEVFSRMMSYRLQVNPAKTEVLDVIIRS